MDFSELDQLPADLQTAMTYRDLANGQILFQRSEEAHAIYAVKTGQIRLLNYTQSGQSISHYTIQVGDICAETALFRDAYTCSAIAEAPTQVLVFPKPAFLSAVQQNRDFALAYMRQLSHRLHRTKTTLEIRTIRSAQERVLHYLRLALPPEQTTVVLEQPLKNLATDLGISSEALSRALTQLERSGAIARQKRSITLLESA